jgi:hypothetical protein
VLFRSNLGEIGRQFAQTTLKNKNISYIKTNLASYNARLAIGSVMPLRAAAIEVSGDKKPDATFYFYSSDPSVAIVNSSTGDITGISEGNAKISIIETKTLVSTSKSIDIVSLSAADAQVLSVLGFLPWEQTDEYMTSIKYGGFTCEQEIDLSTFDVFSGSADCIRDYYHDDSFWFRSDLGLDSSGSAPLSGKAWYSSNLPGCSVIRCQPFVFQGNTCFQCVLYRVPITPFVYVYNNIDPFIR